jgi:hypothetical protein
MTCEKNNLKQNNYVLNKTNDKDVFFVCFVYDILSQNNENKKK